MAGAEGAAELIGRARLGEQLPERGAGAVEPQVAVADGVEQDRFAGDAPATADGTVDLPY